MSKVCAGLKLITMLLGLQGGFVKYYCFLYTWDIRATDKHYLIKDWLKRTKYVCGKLNVIPLRDPEDNVLPLLHIKFRVTKNFLKAMNKNGDRKFSDSLSFLLTIISNRT